MIINRNPHQTRWPYILITLLILTAVTITALLYFRPFWLFRSVARIERFALWSDWFADPQSHPDWAINAGERCGDAPMLLPTTGFIGVGYGDSFRPGRSHSGYDIFSPDGLENTTPVVAAYDGYLTRESNWRSAVIIRHPNFPAVVDGSAPGQQIWSYYTHMASADGTESYISPEFPRGTFEYYVEAGTVLGYQGTWSGNPANPTGLHLHFSIVKSSAANGYTNETDIKNTYDPAPFLGVASNTGSALVCPTG